MAKANKKKFKPDIVIYTDGGCLINPGGPGACAYIIVKDGELSQTSFSAYRSTTNNRMEMLAAIKALENSEEFQNILLYSDSQYLVNTIEQGWARNKNQDLWDALDDLMYSRTVRFKWIRGHDGNQYNEICDQLCSQAMRNCTLDIDEGYEKRANYDNNAISEEDIAERLKNLKPIPESYKSEYGYGSWKDLQKEKGIKDGCAMAIHSFYSNGDDHKFAEYVRLKVGGFDLYSNYKKDQLIEMIGQDNWNKIWGFFEDDKKALKASKWVCRGLSLYDAIKVVIVHEEIAQKKGFK